MCDLSRQQLQEADATSFVLPVSPCSHDLTLHLSFDFAQQVHSTINNILNLTSSLGPLSIQSTTAGAYLFFDSPEVWSFWHL